MAEKPFYEVSDYTGYLREGAHITVQRDMRYLGENADFKPFLNVPIADLEQQLKDSKAAEKKVYDDLQTMAKAWDEHGARTLLLERAIEYLKTPIVEHTGNEWKQREDGTWEISNLVYKMTFRILKSADVWKLTWELQYTAPGLSQAKYRSYCDQGLKKRIEYEGSKKYKTLAGAQKYIQSKFDQYADCFEALSPPVPTEAKDLFCVNGQVLQGYSIMRAPPKKEKLTVSDLLDCLDETDVEPLPSAEPVIPSKGKVHTEPPAQAPLEQAAAPPLSEQKQETPAAKPSSAAKRKSQRKETLTMVR